MNYLEESVSIDAAFQNYRNKVRVQLGAYAMKIHT